MWPSRISALVICERQKYYELVRFEREWLVRFEREWTIEPEASLHPDLEEIA